MKREYVTPGFYAENYEVTCSIAACQYHVGDSDHEQLVISEGDKVCVKNGSSDNGHPAGKNGALITTYPVTLFNDGPDKDDYCAYDWNGTGKVTDPNGVEIGLFGEAFFGAVADNDNHKPGYNGRTFFS